MDMRVWEFPWVSHAMQSQSCLILQTDIRSTYRPVHVLFNELMGKSTTQLCLFR